MDQLAAHNEIARIEELVKDLPADSGTPSSFMREHLEEARFYLLGSMPAEYRLTLSLAEHLLPQIQDTDLQHRISHFLKEQLSETAPAK